MGSNDAQSLLKHIAGDCIAVRVRLLNRMITSIFDEALRPFGIRSSQLNILVAVAAYGPVTSRQLCAVLHMDRSTFSRAVARMRKKGWLTVEPSGEGKVQSIHVTEGGQGMIRNVYPIWKGAQGKAADLLGPAAVEAVTAAGNKALLKGMTG